MSTPKIVPKLKAITPMEIYLQQVKGIYDNIRFKRKGLEYIPAQLGGVFGQSTLIKESVVLELTDFEVE